MLSREHHGVQLFLTQLARQNLWIQRRLDRHRAHHLHARQVSRILVQRPEVRCRGLILGGTKEIHSNAPVYLWLVGDIVKLSF